MEELEDTFTLPTTPKIPRTITNSSIANDDTNDSSLSDTLSEDDDDHSKNFSTFPSISKSKSLSRLTDSRVGRMKSSQLKKSKSFGSIYDSGKSHSYSKDDSDISRITGSDGKEDEDGSGSQSPNSIKRGNSSLSYFNENDNKAENGKDKGKISPNAFFFFLFKYIFKMEVEIFNIILNILIIFVNNLFFLFIIYIFIKCNIYI